MAGGSLLEALLAGRTQYADNPLVASGVVAAQSMPGLYNPYAKTSKNLAVTAGTGLLAALLGNIGRSETDNENLAYYKDAQKLMRAKDLTERESLIENNPRLVELGNALSGQEQEMAMDTAVKQAEEQRKLNADIQREMAKSVLEQYPSQGMELLKSFTGTPKDVAPSASPYSPEQKLQEVDSMQSPTVQATELGAQAAPNIPGLGNEITALVNQGYTEKEARAIASKKAEKTAQLNAEREQYGYDPASEQMVDSLRKEFNALPDVKDFAVTKKAADAISGALKDENAVSDLELTRYAILMIEPGMAVREGEQAAVLKSGSLPTQWKGTIKKALTGSSGLTSEIRQGLLNLASRAYEAQRKNYMNAYDLYKNEAANKKIDPNRIAYFGVPAEASDIFGGGQVSEQVNQGDMPTPPEGFELTGKRDANGNWGVRRIK